MGDVRDKIKLDDSEGPPCLGCGEFWDNCECNWCARCEDQCLGHEDQR